MYLPVLSPLMLPRLNPCRTVADNQTVKKESPVAAEVCASCGQTQAELGISGSGFYSHRKLCGRKAKPGRRSLTAESVPSIEPSQLGDEEEAQMAELGEVLSWLQLCKEAFGLMSETERFAHIEWVFGLR